MELFCPNCQKKLLIEDKYAGQPMQCPLCKGTFTAPSLPTFNTAAPTSPPAPPSPILTPATPTPPAAPHLSGAPEMPAKTQSAAPPYQPPVRSTEHDIRFHIWLSPKVLQWFPLAALVIIFLVLFLMSWVWIGYHNTSVASQNGWYVMVGHVWVDTDLKGPAPTASKVKSESEELFEKGPGWGIWTILYFVFGLLLGLGLTGLVAVMGILPIKLPAVVGPFLPWRWAVVAAVLFLGLFLWCLQLLVGFNLENKLSEEINQTTERRTSSMGTESRERKVQEYLRNVQLAAIHRGAALTWIFWLQFLALVCAVLLFVIDFRKTAAIPRIDVLW